MNSQSGFLAPFESVDHPGWYAIECAPIGLTIDLTDGNVTCFRCRLQEGRWFGAEHISPTYWMLSAWRVDTKTEGEMSMSDVSEKPAEEAAEQEPEFAIVEVFGHRKHAGRIYEVERFGAKMLRVDVPKEGDFAKGFTTLFYGGASIFSMAPCDLATVIRANKPYEPASRLTYQEEPDDHDFDEVEPQF